MSSKLFIITGPSAAGKTTVAEKLLQRKSLKLKKFTTCTTRVKRPGEINGRDYHFLDVKTFTKAIQNQEMIEWSKVYGNYYGSRRTDLMKALQGSKHVLIIVDAQGVKKFQKIIPDSCVIFIDTSKTALIKRLKTRGSDARDIAKRINKYEKDIKAKKSADIVILNKDGNLTQAVNQAADFVENCILTHNKAKKIQTSKT